MARTKKIIRLKKRQKKEELDIDNRQRRTRAYLNHVGERMARGQRVREYEQIHYEASEIRLDLLESAENDLTEEDLPPVRRVARRTYLALM